MRLTSRSWGLSLLFNEAYHYFSVRLIIAFGWGLSLLFNKAAEHLLVGLKPIERCLEFFQMSLSSGKKPLFKLWMKVFIVALQIRTSWAVIAFWQKRHIGLACISIKKCSHPMQGWNPCFHYLLTSRTTYHWDNLPLGQLTNRTTYHWDNLPAEQFTTKTSLH